LNPGVPVIGLPEGTALRLENNILNFIGDRDGVLFDGETGKPVQKRTIAKGEDLSSLP
jgi:dipeptidase E